MGEIIRFPIKRIAAGGVYCPPFDLHFPKLYRARVKTTQAHLEEAGLSGDPELKPGEWSHFGFELAPDHVRFIGDATWEPVTHLAPEDQSLVIRHHASLERAEGYLDAHLDVSPIGEDDGAAIYETDHGIFTLIPCPTQASWPGPVIFHLAYDYTRVFGGIPDTWAHIVGPTGTVLDSKTFGYAGA